MRIKEIRIRSFGKLTNRSVKDIPDGLILVTGNNESGKTTMMEFMRSTMFPPSAKKRDVYPAYELTDSGTLVLGTASGDELILQRDGKKVSEVKGKSTPDKMFSMDTETYNSIFAMSLADLSNAEAISSESIRNRFLTIPGGEKVPTVLNDIDTSRKDIMNDARLTPANPVWVLKESVENVNKNIRETRQKSSEYNEKIKEKKELVEKIENATSVRNDADAERIRRSKVEAQRANMNEIARLKEIKERTAYASKLTDGTIAKHSDLLSNIDRLEKEISDIDSTPPFPEEKVIRITRTQDRISAFLDGQKDAQDDDAPAVTENRTASRSGKIPTIPLILFILAGISFAACIFNVMAAVAGVAFAALGAVSLFMGRKKAATAPAPAPGPQTVSEDSLRAEAEAILKAEGIRFVDMRTAEADLRKIMDDNALRTISAAARQRKKDDAAEKKKELADIEKEYGGKDGFERTKNDRKQYHEASGKMETLATSVETATGKKIDEVEQELKVARTQDGTDPNNEISEMNKKVGALDLDLKNMRLDERLGELLTEKDAKETELAKRIKEWGLLSLQKLMIDRSCDELYRNMQPSVITTANRYLGAMTNGRYAIDTDPRKEGIMIRDAAEFKTSKQWSSGLGDQVYLSIKMAVAKEMGSERLPMMLDDVLVRFDQERKRSACAAILEFAKDQQVFLFSCVPLNDMFPAGSFMHIQM